MYTLCPRCLTIFQIDEDALQASLGIVQCGHCATRFDALRSLSNTLPRAPDSPLGDQDPAARVPTLTEAVAPNAPPPAGTGTPGAPAAATPAHERDAHAISIDIPVPESAQPIPEAGSDWFADLETELTSSLIADAARTEPDDASGDNAWRITDLPVPSLSSDPQSPMAFADFRMHYEELADQAAWSASLEDAGTLVSGTPHAPEPELPAQDRQAADWLANDMAVPDPEETDDAPAAKADAIAPGESVVPEELPPPRPGPAPVARNEALPASLFLVQEAADDTGTADAAEPGLAEAAGPGGPQASAAEPPEGSESPPPHADVVSDPAEPLPPVYVRPRRRRSAGIAWALGCLVLVVVLAAQVAWSERVELFRNPATHAWMARTCQVIACHLPPIRDVAKLELVSRDVRPDPRVPGALTITATLRNDAAFRQPWPVVVVELSDLDNNPVAMRRFRPAEYMPDPSRRAAGIAPGATSAIAFEVADPGKRAVSFQFNFE